MRCDQHVQWTQYQFIVTIKQIFIFRHSLDWEMIAQQLQIETVKTTVCFCGACVAQRWHNGLPCDSPGFNSRSERCIYRASHPSQGTVNGGAVSKWPRCRWDVKHNKPTVCLWLIGPDLMVCKLLVYMLLNKIVFRISGKLETIFTTSWKLDQAHTGICPSVCN